MANDLITIGLLLAYCSITRVQSAYLLRACNSVSCSCPCTDRTRFKIARDRGHL